MTTEDLAKFNVTVRQPLSTTYNGKKIREMNKKNPKTIANVILFPGFQVLTAPPPSSGAALLLALNILEGYNMTHLDADTPTYWHRLIEVRRAKRRLR